MKLIKTLILSALLLFIAIIFYFLCWGPELWWESKDAWRKEREAIDTYLQPIIENSAIDANIGSMDWRLSGNGGYLVKMSIDVTGDGHPEIFISYSLASNSRWGASWKVFDSSFDGDFLPYEGNVFLYDDLYIYKNNEIIELRCKQPPRLARYKESGEREIYRFSFGYPNIAETKESMTDDEVEKWIEGAIPLMPKIEAMLVMDYLTDPNAEWRGVSEWSANMSDYFLIPEDKIRIDESEWFTATVALARLKNESSLSSQSDSGTRHESRRPAKKDESGDRSFGKENREKKSGFLIWIPGVIALLMAGIALAKKIAR